MYQRLTHKLFAAISALDSNSIIPKALQGDSVPLVGENETSDQGETLDQQSKNIHEYFLLPFFAELSFASSV